MQGARALALIRGREYAVVEDLQALARDALRHRLVLSYQALAEEVSPDSILDQVLAAVPTPQLDLARVERGVRPRRGTPARSSRGRPPARPAPGRWPRGSCARSTSRSGGGSRGCSPATSGRTSSGRAPSSRWCARTSPATTSGGSTGTSPRARASRTSASTSPSACSSPGSCSTRRPRCSSVRRIAARPTSPRGSASRSGISRRGAATGSASSTFGGDDAARAAAAPGASGPRRSAGGASQRARRRTARDRPRSARRSRAPDALARQRSLVVVVSDFRGPRDWRRPLLELAGQHDVDRRRDPRPARAGAPERRAALARRPGDRPPAPRRHAKPATARALRRRGGGRARRGRAHARVGRRPARRAHDVGRLAPRARRLPPPEPRDELHLAARARRRSLLVPVLVARLHRSRPAARRVAGASSGTPISCRTSSTARRDGCATSRRCSCSSRSSSLIVGVARPHATVSVPREEATIVLAIDVSRSMKATDVEPTRLDAARTAAKTFLAEVPEKFRVGVVSFATRAAVGVAPTEDRDARRTPRSTRSTPGEGTAIGDAVALSLQVGQPAARPDGSAPPTRDRAHLRRRARRRAASTRPRRREQAKRARRPRLLGARGHAGRRRRGDADRRLQADHPRSAEPRDARADRERRPAASSSPRVDDGGSEPRLRGARLAARARREQSRARSPTSSPPSPRRSCSSAARSRRCSSGGFREARARARGARRRRRWRLAVAAPAGARERVRRLRCASPSPGPGSSFRRRRRVPRPQVEFQLTCPRGYVVGGLDARLSVRAIDVSFLGTLGQPRQSGDHDVAVGRVRRRRTSGRVGRGADLPAVHRLHAGAREEARASRRRSSAFPPGRADRRGA